MGKYKLGLVNIKLGEIAEDGDVATVFTAVGDTVDGTAGVTQDDPQKTDIKIEEVDTPIMSLVTDTGAINLAWSTYANDADTLIKFFGGTKTEATSAEGEIWEAPDVLPTIERSISIEWKSGGKMIIPRAQVVGKLATKFQRSALSQIDITATVLQPEKVGVKRLKIINGN